MSLGSPVDVHAAAAADAHPARPAEGERGVDLVLDVVEAVEHRPLLAQWHVVLLPARLGVLVGPVPAPREAGCSAPCVTSRRPARRGPAGDRYRLAATPPGHRRRRGGRGGGPGTARRRGRGSPCAGARPVDSSRLTPEARMHSATSSMFAASRAASSSVLKTLLVSRTPTRVTLLLELAELVDPLRQPRSGAVDARRLLHHLAASPRGSPRSRRPAGLCPGRRVRSAAPRRLPGRGRPGDQAVRAPGGRGEPRRPPGPRGRRRPGTPGASSSRAGWRR